MLAQIYAPFGLQVISAEAYEMDLTDAVPVLLSACCSLSETEWSDLVLPFSQWGCCAHSELPEHWKETIVLLSGRNDSVIVFYKLQLHFSSHFD